MYSTGTASDPHDLLKKLVAILSGVGGGWTVNLSAPNGAAAWRVHLQKGTQFVNLRSIIGNGVDNSWAVPGSADPDATVGGINLYCSSGYDAPSSWNTQPGGPIAPGHTPVLGGATRLPVGPIVGYHVFTDALDNVTVVIETTAGVFTHFGWGVVSKAGAWGQDGQFFFAATCIQGLSYSPLFGPRPGIGAVSAACPCCHADAVLGGASAWIRGDVDAFVGNWLCVAGALTSDSLSFTGLACASNVPNLGLTAPLPQIPHYNALYKRLVGAISAQAVLLPVCIFAPRDAGGYSLLATIPNIFAASGVGQGFSAKTVIALGLDSYMLFPNFAVKQVA